jgi:hypothetical protein
MSEQEVVCCKCFKVWLRPAKVRHYACNKCRSKQTYATFKARVAADPEYAEIVKARQSEQRKIAYRAKHPKKPRKLTTNERYKIDPEFRELQKSRVKAHRSRKKQTKISR